jgi:pre-mRNA-processing factor 8
MQSDYQQEDIPKITLKYFKELVATQIYNNEHINWIFDDTNCYRVTIHKTEEGNLSTAPINGAHSTFNIHSGQLFLKVIHTSKWSTSRKLGQTAKEIAAEELAALIRALPKEEHPQTIFTTRSAVIPFIKQQLIDFPEIQIHACSFFLPLQALLRIPKILDAVMSATEPKMVLFALYDGWQPISPAAAFQRLIIILQALRSDSIAPLDIINPRKENSESFWPKLSNDEWTPIEIQLKKLIVDQFSKRNQVPVESLTEEQIDGAIYGEELSDVHHLLQQQ